MNYNEACQLMRASGKDLLDLLRRAADLREAHKGKTVTYSRKVFIPLTNLCRNHCAYCTFVAAPGEAGAGYLSPEEVLAIARRGALAGCKEALFSLGEKPETAHPLARRQLDSLGYESTLAYLQAMCQLVYEETGLIPHTNAGVMDENEIRALRSWNGSMGLMLETTSRRLLGTGEAHDGCPGKDPQARLETLAAAGRQRVPFTTGILIGIGETVEERVESLLAIAELQARYGHIQEVIIQNFRRKAGIRFFDREEPGVLEMLRTIAVARLLLGGEMNLQAPPNLTPEAYALYLLAGINDWGGISPVTLDYINPEAAWPQITELQRISADAGYELRQRLTVYPEYLTRQTDFVAPHILAHARKWIDKHGLVVK